MQSNILWPIYALLKHLFFLPIVDNIFTYEIENEGTKQLILDEKEEIWLGFTRAGRQPKKER